MCAICIPRRLLHHFGSPQWQPNTLHGAILCLPTQNQILTSLTLKQTRVRLPSKTIPHQTPITPCASAPPPPRHILSLDVLRLELWRASRGMSGVFFIGRLLPAEDSPERSFFIYRKGWNSSHGSFSSPRMWKSSSGVGKSFKLSCFSFKKKLEPIKWKAAVQILSRAGHRAMHEERSRLTPYRSPERVLPRDCALLWMPRGPSRLAPTREDAARISPDCCSPRLPIHPPDSGLAASAAGTIRIRSGCDGLGERSV